MRPCKEIAELRSRTMRASSAMTIGAIARDREREAGLAGVDGGRRARRPCRGTRAPRETFDEPLDEQREPSLDRRRFGPHEEGREPARRAARARRPPPTPLRASTTMKANEMGSAARSGGRSSISSPAAIAPPIDARAQPTACPGRRSRSRPRPTRPRARRTSTWPNVSRLAPPAPRERARRHEVRAAEPVPASGGATPTRARRPRGRRRTARRGARSPTISASTHASLNCVPDAVAQLGERGLLRQRPAVRTGRRHGVEGVGDVDDRAARSAPVPSTAAVAASVVVSPATGARKSMRRSSSTDTTSWRSHPLELRLR